MSRSTFRRRLFRTLLLVALLPAVLILAGGVLLLREVVAATGSAGAWGAVAESGRHLLELLRAEGISPEATAAAARHREVLSESVRLSRVYGILGDRIVLLTPVAALVLLGAVAAVAGWASRRVAASLAAPAEELAGWIRALGEGRALPPEKETPSRRGVAEFAMLRSGLREASGRLEEARRREVERARTRSWTEMARGVAHEIKNPLTPMRMAAERSSRSEDPGAARAGRTLLEEIERLDELARAFSQFGRPIEGPPAPVDLNELLGTLQRHLAGEGAPVEVALPEAPVLVQGHLAALERVVRNLVSNAIDAREAGGSAEPVRIELRPEEGEATIRVEDRGPGIPPEILERIWEPDFTTRKRGTGLGLPLVRQAVRSHGGRVRAGNRPDGGAVFEVRLPVKGAGAEGDEA